MSAPDPRVAAIFAHPHFADAPATSGRLLACDPYGRQREYRDWLRAMTCGRVRRLMREAEARGDLVLADTLARELERRLGPIAWVAGRGGA